MRAMVLAAGLGTRLRPLTYEITKPMVPVLDRPVMEHILDLLDRHGFEQVIAQVELFSKNEDYEKRVYVLPKHLDEKVARLHLDALGARLTQLSEEQAAYIDVSVDGPFKPDHYRY